jgi:hypothetical protein
VHYARQSNKSASSCAKSADDHDPPSRGLFEKVYHRIIKKGMSAGGMKAGSSGAR